MQADYLDSMGSLTFHNLIGFHGLLQKYLCFLLFRHSEVVSENTYRPYGDLKGVILISVPGKGN
jgi:hypothetical protein